MSGALCHSCLQISIVFLWPKKNFKPHGLAWKDFQSYLVSYDQRRISNHMVLLGKTFSPIMIESYPELKKCLIAYRHDVMTNLMPLQFMLGFTNSVHSSTGEASSSLLSTGGRKARSISNLSDAALLEVLSRVALPGLPSLLSFHCCYCCGCHHYYRHWSMLLHNLGIHASHIGGLKKILVSNFDSPMT